MLVYYDDGSEVIVTTEKQEKGAIRDYITERGCSVRDYKRTVVPEDAVLVIYHPEKPSHKESNDGRLRNIY